MENCGKEQRIVGDEEFCERTKNCGKTELWETRGIVGMTGNCGREERIVGDLWNYGGNLRIVGDGNCRIE